MLKAIESLRTQPGPTIHSVPDQQPQVVVVMARAAGCRAKCDQAIDRLVEAGALVYSHEESLAPQAGYEDLLWAVASTIERALEHHPGVPLVLASDKTLATAIKRLAEIFGEDINGLVVVDLGPDVSRLGA